MVNGRHDNAVLRQKSSTKQLGLDIESVAEGDEYGRKKTKNFRGLASELMQLSTGGQNSKSSRVSQQTFKPMSEKSKQSSCHKFEFPQSKKILENRPNAVYLES